MSLSQLHKDSEAVPSTSPLSTTPYNIIWALHHVLAVQEKYDNNILIYILYCCISIDYT
jgi:hypothetical protein